MKNKNLDQAGVIALVLVVVFMFIIGIGKATAQQTQAFVECTAGEFSTEITWQILTCNGSVILEGGAPYFGAAILPQYYQINMQDSYGDGWNGAYLYIDEAEYGFLSDVDWIDSLGTWPQDQTQQLVDVGCLTIGVEEVEGTNFIPTHYYDILGREVTPSKGIYFATDGILTRKIYIK
tara:strand:- start:1272 stop:1805 length:534 start_codon:yes stop_codon:yes gene_type:complete